MKSYIYQSIGDAHSEIRFGFAAGEYAGFRGLATTLKAAKTGKSLLRAGELARIENAATRIGKPINVVGSRASGTAKATSDWDYVIESLTNKQWKQIKNSLPGAPSKIDNLPRMIDIFKGPVDPTKPFITIFPK
ncbi:nucleotidyltransferase family protein [Sphingobacterium endophyticum]|uniref:hypothetical protein n=1 Tax=Sphingobacterium endophyticum TaxID=2546448 RepID=UPI0012E2509D|nr:hypothetical protein [Sphingobacterium endophyticum]